MKPKDVYAFEKVSNIEMDGVWVSLTERLPTQIAIHRLWFKKFQTSTQLNLETAARSICNETIDGV